MMADTVIKTEALTKIFERGRKREIVALDRVDLEVRRGEVFGLLGPNGAGKTTLIRLLVGLLTPTSGRAFVLGRDVTQDIDYIRERVALLPQEAGIYERLTARENLVYYGGLYGIPEDELNRRADRLLDIIGLTDRQHHQVKSFSGGMKRKVLVARALIIEPELVFLDEPTTGVDTLGARVVRNMLKKLSSQENRTIVLTTHDLHEVSELCDRVGILNKGQLVAVGKPNELEDKFKAANLEEVFTALVTGEGLEA
ncbi:MAG: ABC transporter ATP-binding protein [Candidatus Thorarchaeota archaeon]|nr:MAG: multidrug ABC transporter ATP-binding protein [Candidatus Thorarchaeota archaeon]RLI60737.1 MAG: multidrug ABC transporter ATP-binding protein [Candidatus Thorarchaeota archaeon]